MRCCKWCSHACDLAPHGRVCVWRQFPVHWVQWKRLKLRLSLSLFITLMWLLSGDEKLPDFISALISLWLPCCRQSWGPVTQEIGCVWFCLLVPGILWVGVASLTGLGGNQGVTSHNIDVTEWIMGWHLTTLMSLSESGGDISQHWCHWVNQGVTSSHNIDVTEWIRGWHLLTTLMSLSESWVTSHSIDVTEWIMGWHLLTTLMSLSESWGDISQHWCHWVNHGVTSSHNVDVIEWIMGWRLTTLMSLSESWGWHLLTTLMSLSESGGDISQHWCHWVNHGVTSSHNIDVIEWIMGWYLTTLMSLSESWGDIFSQGCCLLVEEPTYLNSLVIMCDKFGTIQHTCTEAAPLRLWTNEEISCE